MAKHAAHAASSANRKHPARYLVPFAVALFLELTLFNFHFWLDVMQGSPDRAFLFSPPRFAVTLFIAYCIFAFWPTSRLYKTPLATTRAQIAVIVLVVAVHAASFALITQHVDEDQFFTEGTTKFDGAVYDDGQQYAYLADSIIAGRTWLDLKTPDWLASMDNPYDAGKRFELAYATGEPFYWDFAFYKGHYYCYFGAFPALVAFVPFKLATGHDLRTDYAVALFAILLSIAIATFLFRFMRRYFPWSSLGLYLLAFMMFAMGCGVLTQVFYPLFYSLPPLAGLTCVFFGLAAWMGARRPDGTLSKPLLVLGSVLVACTLECRPQMFVVILLAFPLFWNEIAKERLFFSRKGLANTLCIIVPCALIGGLAMWYNAARFGSPFDFGASYNLTGFDMTQKAHGINLHAMLVSLLFYLAMPLDFKPDFPYLDEIQWRSDVPVEPFYGSFFAFAPAALAVLGIWHFRKALQQRGLLHLSIISCALALVLMVLSAQIASISMRYFSDFCWALLIPALAVWLVWIERSEGNNRKILIIIGLFMVLVIGSEALNYWSLLSVGKYGQVMTQNPNVYAFMQAWFSI